MKVQALEKRKQKGYMVCIKWRIHCSQCAMCNGGWWNAGMLVMCNVYEWRMDHCTHKMFTNTPPQAVISMMSASIS